MTGQFDPNPHKVGAYFPFASAIVLLRSFEDDNPFLLLYTLESPMKRDSDLPFPVGLLLASISCLRTFIAFITFSRFVNCC